MKNESKLGKIINNLNVLVPFKIVYEINKTFKGKKSSWGDNKALVNIVWTTFTVPPLLSAIIGLGPNPLNWSENYQQIWDNKQKEKIEYNVQRQEFPPKLYKQLSGADGVIDSTEFINFYKKADSLGISYYPKLSEFYNKK